MKFFQPKQGVGDKEIFHFIFAIIENLCAPVGMLAQAGIGMLEDTLAVKTAKPVSVHGKMSRHPVQNHADLVSVQQIDQIH